MRLNKNGNSVKSNSNKEVGFTVVEVIIAGMLMTILCVGTLSIYSYMTKINSGENLRMQALSVLQQEVEYYRSLKFVPIGSSTELNGGNYQNLRTRTSADGKVFSISVKIDNDPYTAGLQTAASSPVVPDADCKFKEITIEVKPQVAQTGWLSNLRTNVTIQRVRSN